MVSEIGVWFDLDHMALDLKMAASTSSEPSDLSISSSDPGTSTNLSIATETGAIEPRSLLRVLRAPKASDLARERKIASNPPSGKRSQKDLLHQSQAMWMYKIVSPNSLRSHLLLKAINCFARLVESRFP